MKSVDSLPKTTISGRRFTRKQLALVQETVLNFPRLSRAELALTVCELLDWRNPGGSLKIQSCHVLLEVLESHCVITLPPKRAKKASTRREPRFDSNPESTAIDGPLSSVAPVALKPVISQEERERWKAYLQTYHYLGYKHPFGAHMGYMIVSEAQQRDLGCLLFSASAAWTLAPRDQFIQWDDTGRRKNLQLVLSNDRFLILPWIQVPHLASHALSLATKQIADDWVRAHGYRPALIETFVDTTRYSGTCYRASNWHLLGQTQGRGRMDTKHEHRETKKDIFVFPLGTDWRERLTQRLPKAELKKQYRNDLARARTRLVGDEFISLWEKVADLLQEVASEYDRKWRVRKRVIDSLMLMLLILRLVSSKNSQSYGTTIDELWDSCDRLDLPLAQEHSIAPSSFCEARRKLDESVFRCANARILDAYSSHAERYTWRGHRLFAIDGSKITLPPALVKHGYRLPNQESHYPQGLASCLFELRSQLAYDFELVSHADERLCARGHIRCLRENDVVVYDRGYFSYLLLHQHVHSGVHAVFRMQERISQVKSFLASGEADSIVSVYPPKGNRKVLQMDHPDLDIVPLQVRLIRYEIKGFDYCLATTLVEQENQYPIQDFIDIYHSRWGVEELYKVSKVILQVEDFHAKTERGVRQEVYAHFLLITMNRLFANHADFHLNDSNPLGNLNESDETTAQSPPLRTNFKNCCHVLQRNLEELLLLKSRVALVVESTFRRVVSQFQRTRPGRSYPRVSMKPPSKWKLSSKKRKKQQRPAPSPIMV
jgi:hypothetical protein